jgi:hypothetical protein
MTNREVAHALFITTKTASARLSRVYRKLGITRRAQLPDALAAGVRASERRVSSFPKAIGAKDATAPPDAATAACAHTRPHESMLRRHRTVTTYVFDNASEHGGGE